MKGGRHRHVFRYGIGQIYYRQEQFVEAEKHFRRASTINRRSSVLHCYLGMALHKQGRTAEALQRLQVLPPPPLPTHATALLLAIRLVLVRFM